MSIPRILLTIIGTAIVVVGQQPATGGALARLSQSAGEKLARSSAELNQLREQIAGERLPLAQELTSLEEKVALLRKEHERVTRLVDSGNLELPALKAEIKVRQDEQSYIANLLDEYARTFESKINVSEMQVFGPAIATAKEATENTTLLPAEKFARQLGFVTLSLKRLADAVGGVRFPGVGVDSAGAVTPGDFALFGPVALFRPKSGTGAGVVVAQTGSVNPLIRPLEGELGAGIAALVQSGEGSVPLDPSHGGALKALVQKTNLFHIFEKGGPIMWPLLAASILAVATALERLIFLMIERSRRSQKALDAFFAAVERHDTREAIRIAGKSRFYVVRALGYALEHREKSLSSAILYASGLEIKRYRRGIPILDTVITLAPLLGLLGTVVGMMGSFSLIGGDLSAPGAITGGIAEALIATAFGLGIAISSVLPFNILNTKLEDVRREIEAAGTQLELLVHPGAVTVSGLGVESHSFLPS